GAGSGHARKGVHTQHNGSAVWPDQPFDARIIAPADGEEGPQAGRLNPGSGGSIEWRWAEVIGSSRGVLGLIIVNARLGPHFHNRQRFAVENADSCFAALNFLFHENM